MPLDRQRTDVLERLWDEAEKSVAAQRVSLPMGNSGGLQFGGPVGSRGWVSPRR